MKRRKPYSLEQSPLYRLGNRARLCSLLHITRDQLPRLQSDEFYRIFSKRSDGKARTIEEPRGTLKKVHRRLHILLSRMEHPEWCFSGIRGRSHVDNARCHAGVRYLMACDIHSFYQSSRKEYVFRFFHNRMKQVQDIAWLLVDIATFDDHLPTGSSSSSLLAFRAYEPMFQSLRDLAIDAEAEFSLYVDDMTFSSEKPLRAGLVGDVSRIVKAYGLELKKSKTRFYGPKRWKKVTGGAISPEGDVTIPNRLLHEIHRYSEALKRGGLVPSEIRRLHGLLSEARQIDPMFGEHLYRFVCQRIKVRNNE